MTILGRSNRSLRIEKQKVAGTGAPEGFSSTQWEYTDCVVFSNACAAKFSQYSTTDWFSNNYTPQLSDWGGASIIIIILYLINILFTSH
jgi:hypothetical protein